MTKSSKEKERLSIDVQPDEHRLIKMYAAHHGVSIRVYVLESVRKRLSEDEEVKQLSAMTTYAGTVLKELWDNDKDAAYDNL